MATAIKSLPTLQSNDTVALVCTGSATTQETVIKTQHYLAQHYGFNIIYGKDTYQGTSVADRANIFLNYLFDPNIKAIWSLRGGEGTADLLTTIDAQAAVIAKLAPKLLIGVSDFTAMLVYFAQKYRWPVVHGSAAWQFVDSLTVSSRQITADLLLNKINKIEISDLTALNLAAQKTAVIDGELTGGNLSLLAISVKDHWELMTTDKIVIIEDVAEKAHKVSRTLKYLQRIGLFDKAKAIIFGDFNFRAIGETNAEQQNNARAIDKALQLFADSCAFPVLKTKRVGHGHTNDPFIYNMFAQLYTGKQASLQIAIPSHPQAARPLINL